MVVLGVGPEGLGDELELWGWIAELDEEEASVVPDLVCLEMLDGDFIHEPQLSRER